MDLTVVVATYGEDHWRETAARALASAALQANVVYAHGETLARARNEALDSVRSEWVIHLDADDELELGYVEAMAAGTAEVRAPVARYIRAGSERLWRPHVFAHDHVCQAACLRDGNWVLIGAAVRTEAVREVGGWVDFDWSEDWALWAKLFKAGASFELIEDAVYRAHVRPDSRNRAATAEEKEAAHRAIERHVWPEAVPA